MKTITFYSYKGGVGRTLALVNIANRLAEFGKKVCIIDFDLEAPGLAHKYRHQIDLPIKKGIVDYIYEFSANNNLIESISDFHTIIRTNYKSQNIFFIPAGNTDSGEYWKKLSKISWWDIFYSENSVGIPFFLDLKEKIIESFSPDYLLIDTRTGITEISAITMSILADSVVVFAANNYENIAGSQKIIETITKKENNLLDNIKEIHFTITRIPLPLTPENKTAEKELLLSIEKKISNSLLINNRKLDSFNIIHSDRDTEFNEQVKIGYDFDKKDKNKIENQVYSISFEYLSLFNSLTKNELSEEEKIKFDHIKQFEQIIEKAKRSLKKLSQETLSQINEAKELLPDNPESYLIEGMFYMYSKNYAKAIQSFNKSIELGDVAGEALFYRSYINSFMGNNKEALADINQYLDCNFSQNRISAKIFQLIIKERLGFDVSKLLNTVNKIISEHPDKPELYNLRSNFHRIMKNYEDALVDIYKALELDSENPIYYGTLAEIKAKQGDKLDFYRNFDMSLQKGYDAFDILNQNIDIQNIYKEFYTDEKFISILEKNSQFDFINHIKLSELGKKI